MNFLLKMFLTLLLIFPSMSLCQHNSGSIATSIEKFIMSKPLVQDVFFSVCAAFVAGETTHWLANLVKPDASKQSKISVAGIAASLAMGSWLTVVGGHPRWGAAVGGAGSLFFSRLIPEVLDRIFRARDEKIKDFLNAQLGITATNENGEIKGPIVRPRRLLKKETLDLLNAQYNHPSHDLVIPLSLEQRSSLLKLAQAKEKINLEEQAVADKDRFFKHIQKKWYSQNDVCFCELHNETLGFIPFDNWKKDFRGENPIRLWHCFFNRKIDMDSYEMRYFAQKIKNFYVKYPEKTKTMKIAEDGRVYFAGTSDIFNNVKKHLLLNNRLRHLVCFQRLLSDLLPAELMEEILKYAYGEYPVQQIAKKEDKEEQEIDEQKENKENEELRFSPDVFTLISHFQDISRIEDTTERQKWEKYSLISPNDLLTLIKDLPRHYNQETKSYTIGTDPENSCIIDGEPANYIKALDLLVIDRNTIQKEIDTINYCLRNELVSQLFYTNCQMPYKSDFCKGFWRCVYYTGIYQPKGLSPQTYEKLLELSKTCKKQNKCTYCKHFCDSSDPDIEKKSDLNGLD